jgi:DNA polymerase III epsilon subunit-like protein
MPDRPSHWTDLAEFVAIDLETTGFDRLNDRMIEVGAVRFDRSGVTDRFQTFVDPGRPIPREVRALTSIEDADVAGAPTPTLALSRLSTFVGGSPIVGHNVRFDLDFLATGSSPRWSCRRPGG